MKLKTKSPKIRTNERTLSVSPPVLAKLNGWTEGTKLIWADSPCPDVLIINSINDAGITLNNANSGRYFTLDRNHDYREIDDIPEPVAGPVKLNWPDGSVVGTSHVDVPGGRMMIGVCAVGSLTASLSGGPVAITLAKISGPHAKGHILFTGTTADYELAKAVAQAAVDTAIKKGDAK